MRINNKFLSIKSFFQKPTAQNNDKTLEKKQFYILAKRRWWHLFARKDSFIEEALTNADNDPVGFLVISVPILENRKTKKISVPSCLIGLSTPLNSAENSSCLSEVRHE